jgi:hypothetical protein
VPPVQLVHCESESLVQLRPEAHSAIGEQAEQTRSAVALQAALSYSLAAHAPEQLAHAVSAVGVQAAVWN